MGSRTIALVLIVQIAHSYAHPQLNITSLRLQRGNDLLYSFPLVYSSNKQAAQKINYYLQKELLWNDTVLTDTNTVFEKSRFVNKDTTWQSGITDMSYTVEVNNSRIVSFVFQLETMGAYPESYPAYHNFNSQTGALLSAKDLFTPSGITEIKKNLIRERKKRIVEWLNEMDSTYNIGNERGEIAETFKQCNSEVDEDNLSIKERSIVFCKDYCFPHVSRPYDTDLDIEFTFNRLDKYLSDKGKKLLLLKR